MLDSSMKCFVHANNDVSLEIKNIKGAAIYDSDQEDIRTLIVFNKQEFSLIFDRKFKVSFKFI